MGINKEVILRKGRMEEESKPFRYLLTGILWN